MGKQVSVEERQYFMWQRFIEMLKRTIAVEKTQNHTGSRDWACKIKYNCAMTKPGLISLTKKIRIISKKIITQSFILREKTKSCIHRVTFISRFNDGMRKRSITHSNNMREERLDPTSIHRQALRYKRFTWKTL